MGDLNINYMSNEAPNILSVILISECVNCINKPTHFDNPLVR